MEEREEPENETRRTLVDFCTPAELSVSKY